MPNGSLLDASALIALILREPGWKVVDAIAETGLALTTPIALIEVFEFCRRRKTGISQDEIRTLLELKSIRVVSVVVEDATEAGYIYKKAAEHNLNSKRKIRVSLADVMLLAVGKRLGAVVVYSDNEWELIDLPGISVLPFR